jgi:hypothetical protein
MFHIAIMTLALPSLTIPHPAPAANPYRWPAEPIPGFIIQRPATKEEMHAIYRIDNWGETSEYLQIQNDEN